MNQLFFYHHLQMNTSYKMSCWFGIVCFLVFSNTLFAAISEENPSKISIFKEQGEKSFLRGDFENAIIQWTGLAEKYTEQNNTAKHAETLIKLANAHYALAQYSVSLEILNKANKLVDNPKQKITIMNSLGATYLAMGKYPKADELLQTSADMARKNNEIDLLIESLNNLGNLKIKKGRFYQALDDYSKGMKLAQTSGNKKLIAKSSINMAIASFEIESRDNVGAKLAMAKIYLEETEDDHNKAFNWITLGQVGKKLVKSTLSDKSDWQSFAHHAFRQAESVGKRISDARAISYAKGYRAAIHSERTEYEEALQLSREAVLSIEKIHEPGMLYQWQWQIGRILKDKGDIKAVIPAYQQTVSTLSSICKGSSAQQFNARSFQDDIRPIYLELIDLLLQANDTLKDDKKNQQNLVEVRSAIEQLKAAELQDYFKDVCVSVLQQKIKALDTIDPHTAVVYPILFNNRVEVLLSVPSGLKRFTLPVTRKGMIDEIGLFRRKLGYRTTQAYLPHAQKLYRWLVTPLQATLTKYKINTLVIVPDEFLRTIPIAALHDGEKFLIEKYAIANAPGLSMTDSKPITAENEKVLLGGVAESEQGFSVLQDVITELSGIKKIFGDKELLGKHFVLNSLKKELKQTPYNIVHIASHTLFKGEAQDSFVLTFDDKLNMDELEQLIGLGQNRKNPVELLTLSASQTSAGDDRAALGLTGIAIKTGASSAIATLWLINDQATSVLITKFYRQLKDGNVTKAQAIKNAQVHLIKNTPYQHPYFWSPFLLIGNWL